MYKFNGLESILLYFTINQSNLNNLTVKQSFDCIFYPSEKRYDQLGLCRKRALLNAVRRDF